MKKYTITNIYEADYGCEGLREGEQLKVVVHLKDEKGEIMTLEEEDAWLITNKIKEGNKVIINTSGRLVKVVNVVAAIIKGNGENKGKILATQRGYGEFKGGWEFPGGKIEEGETPEEALIREIKEELDVKIEVEEMIDIIEYDYPTFHLSMKCYWCKVESGEVVLKEHKAAKWLSKETLHSVDWLPADVSLIDKISKLKI